MLTDPVVVNSYSELLATSMYVQSYAHVCTHILYIWGILMSILLLLLQQKSDTGEKLFWVTMEYICTSCNLLPLQELVLNQ